jgi:hypothetical protein
MTLRLIPDPKMARGFKSPSPNVVENPTPVSLSLENDSISRANYGKISAVGKDESRMMFQLSDSKSISKLAYVLVDLVLTLDSPNPPKRE